jgi:hypothetical protein
VANPSYIYPRFLQGIMAKEHDLLNDTIKVAMVSGVYNSANTIRQNVAVQIEGPEVVLTGKSITNGVFSADKVTLTGINTTATIYGLVIYNDSATSPLNKPLIVYHVLLRPFSAYGVTSVEIVWQKPIFNLSL